MEPQRVRIHEGAARGGEIGTVVRFGGRSDGIGWWCEVRFADGEERSYAASAVKWIRAKVPSEPVPAWKTVQIIGETDSPTGKLFILRHPDGGKSYANPGAMHPLPQPNVVPYGIDLAQDRSGAEVEALREAAADIREAAANMLNCVDGQHDQEWLIRCKSHLAATIEAFDSLHPSSEIAAASRALQAALDRAQKNITPERDRLRAALAREPTL